MGLKCQTAHLLALFLVSPDQLKITYIQKIWAAITPKALLRTVSFKQDMDFDLDKFSFVCCSLEYNSIAMSSINLKSLAIVAIMNSLSLLCKMPFFLTSKL